MAEERKAAVVVVAVDMSEHAQKALECEYNVVHAHHVYTWCIPVVY